MKKLLAIIILSVAMVSCYEEYVTDFYWTGIYFPYQQDVRTFVVGEGMKFEVGAALGGVRKNTVNRNVSFVLDPTLINQDQLLNMQQAGQTYIKNATLPVDSLMQLPDTYYSLSNSSTMVIQSGWHSGTIVVRPDSANFLDDSVRTIYATYALPFRITACPEVDSIVNLKRTNVVGVKFENMLFGNYWHGGAAVVNRPLKSDTTIVYMTTVPCEENKIWTLTTVGPSTLICNGYYNAQVLSAKPNQLKLVLKGNIIGLSAAAGSSYAFTQDGECTFNRNKLLQARKIFLKYTFTDAVSGFTYHCTDTLTYRNRIRDGVNEWQDENPSHYTK